MPWVQLLAESDDDDHFRLSPTPGTAIATRLAPNQVMEPDVGTERGCVFDDGLAHGETGGHRLKLLMSNASVFEGDACGTNWTRRPH